MNVTSNKAAPKARTRRRAPGGAGSPLARFRKFLRQRGLRLTRQRRLILQDALRRREHFDVEQMHESLRSAGGNVSMATVYRTLMLLRDCGLVRELLQCRGRVHYEAVVGRKHHDHMVCIRCGRVIEFYDARIEQLQERLCRRHGFLPLEHRMGIRGLCRECRDAEESRA